MVADSSIVYSNATRLKKSLELVKASASMGNFRKIITESGLLLSYTAVSVFAMLKVLLSPGVISYLFDWDIPPFASQFQNAFLTRIYSWNPFQVMGLPYSVGTDTYYYFFLRLLGPLGGEIVSKFILVLVFALAGLGMFHLCKILKINSKICWACGLFYMFTPTTYLETAGGHLPTVISYALAPIALYFLIRALKDPKVKNVVISGLVLTIAWTYIDFVVILFILSLAICLAFSGSIKRNLKIFVGSTLIAFGMHFFWILPLLNDIFSGNIVLRTAGEASRLYIRLSVVYGASSPVSDTLRLKTFFMGPDPTYWPQLWTGQTLWIALSFLLPVLVFGAVLLRKQKLTFGLAVVALMGVTFSSGVTILGSIYSWLILNIPYFNIFTAVSRWLPLAIIPYAVLLGITFDELGTRSIALTKYLPFRTSGLIRRIKHWKFPLLSNKTNKQKSAGVFLSFVIFCSFIIGFAGSFFVVPPRILDSRLHTYSFNQGEEAVYQSIAQIPGDFRIANYPLLGDLGVSNYIDGGADPMGVFPPKSAIQFGQGFSSISDPAAYTRFLSLTSYLQKTNNVDQLLGLANVQYIIYYKNRTDIIDQSVFNPWYPNNQTQALSYFFENQQDLKTIQNDDNIAVYEIPSPTSHIYAVNNMDIITGDRSALLGIAKTDYNLSKNALIFARQIPFGEGSETYNLSRQIIITDDNTMDLLVPFLSSDYIINPGFYSTTSKWIAIDNEWWGKWRFSSSENFGDGIFTRTPKDTVDISYNAPESTEYEIWANLYYDASSFSTSFKVDNSSGINIDTIAPTDAGFKWTSIGSTYLTKGSHTISVTNGETGTSALLQMLVIPKDIASSIRNNVTDIIGNKPLIYITKPMPVIEPLYDSTQLLQGISVVSGTDKSGDFNYTSGFQNGSFALAAKYYLNGNTNEGILGHLNLAGNHTLSELQALNVTVKLQEPKLQYLEFKLNLDTNDDGVVDTVIPAFHVPSDILPNTSTQITFDLSSIAGTYHLVAAKTRLLGLQIVFQKAWGGDASQNPHPLTFEIQKINLNRNTQISDMHASYGDIILSNTSSMKQSILRSDNYQILVRAKSNTTATLQLYIDGADIKKTIPPQSDYNWVNMGQIYLSQGEHAIQLNSPQPIDIDLLIVRTGDKSPQAPTPTLGYEQINPTEYHITSNATQPYFLVFMENYDPSWRLDGSAGSSNLHLQAYGLGSLFYVSSASSEARLVYGRQFLFSVGFIVSEAIVILLAIVLLIPSKMSKKITAHLRRPK